MLATCPRTLCGAKYVVRVLAAEKLLTAAMLTICGCVHDASGRCVIEKSPTRCAGIVTVGSIEGNRFVLFSPDTQFYLAWPDSGALSRESRVPIDFASDAVVSKVNKAWFSDSDRSGKVRRWEDAEPAILARIRGHWSSSKSDDAVLVIDEIDIVGIVPVSYSTLGVTVVKPDYK